MEFKTIAALANKLEKTTLKMATLTTQAAVLGSFVLYGNVLKAYGDSNILEHLAESTQEDRERLGFTPNDPLLRDGSLLRDHEEREVIGDVASVGNTNIISLFHELGYLNARTGTDVPARPVHLKGMEASEAEVNELLLKLAQKIIGT